MPARTRPVGTWLLGRADRLLTWRRAGLWALLVCVVYVTAYVYVLASGEPPLNVSGVPIGGDYIAFHTAGRLILKGQAHSIYDQQTVVEVQAELLGGRSPGFYDAFRNPPFAALPFVPLALLDLLPGFGVWSALSLACLGMAMRLLLEEVPDLQRHWRALLLLVFAFPPLYFGLIDGENATVSLLLYVLIYRSLVRGRGRSAGIWAALGLFKPQLFLVFPLVFLATRRWRALGAYFVTTGLLSCISLALVGVDGLQAWLRILVEPESGNALANAWRMASLKSFFDLLLPGQLLLLASGLYATGVAILLAALFSVWVRARPPLRQAWTITSLVAVLIDPHLVDYDLSVLIPAGIFAALSVPATRWLLVLLYAVLLFRAQIAQGGIVLQLSTPVLVSCLVVVWRSTQGPPRSGALSACRDSQSTGSSRQS